MNNVESILASATEEQIAEARDWASDCIGLADGEKVGAERAVKYIEKNYPGGWAGFLTEIFPVQPEAVQSASVSGYANCACRDCMDVTVSSDTSKPELCSECAEAGCEPCMAYVDCLHGLHHECQRDDAEGDEYGSPSANGSCGRGATGIHGVDHSDLDGGE